MDYTDPPTVFSPTPMSDICADGINCAGCDQHLTDQAYYDGVGDYYCERCIDALAAQARDEAEVFAAENCEITGDLSWDDNSMAHLRHTRTNYEELIASLDRDSVVDRQRYLTIRKRIGEMLEDEILNLPDGHDHGEVA
jgi:hypothetical protein